MCGIVGYVGVKQAAPILLSGLSKLEYRGYDSAGIAVRDDAAEHIEVVKAKGRLKNLMEMTDSGLAVCGTCGVGHTRWATHGEPSAVNAHPHYSKEKRVVVVHNGIIENYQDIKAALTRKGYVFKTYEGTLIMEGFRTAGQGSLQSNQFVFSVDDANLADSLMRMSGRHVELKYNEYLGALPWRGYSNFIVEEILSVK